jgi:type II secretion system protein N
VKSHRTLFIVIFVIVFVLTFPFQYLKDWMFTKVATLTRNQVQLYARDLGVGVRGLTFSGVSMSVQDIFTQLESLSVRPSIGALFHGAIGITTHLSGMFDSSLDADIGKKWGGYYVSLDSDRIELAKLPFLTQMIPGIKGGLEFDSSLSLSSFAPISGQGDVRVRASSLEIPKPFQIQFFAIPAIKKLKPGIDGTATLQGSNLVIKSLQVGGKGQSLYATVEGKIGTVGFPYNAPLELKINLVLGPELLSDPNVVPLLNSPFTAPYKKSENTFAFSVTGTTGNAVVGGI